jgi:hypothetical protein
MKSDSLEGNLRRILRDCNVNSRGKIKKGTKIRRMEVALLDKIVVARSAVRSRGWQPLFVPRTRLTVW